MWWFISYHLLSCPTCITGGTCEKPHVDLFSHHQVSVTHWCSFSGHDGSEAIDRSRSASTGSSDSSCRWGLSPPVYDLETMGTSLKGSYSLILFPALGPLRIYFSSLKHFEVAATTILSKLHGIIFSCLTSPRPSLTPSGQQMYYTSSRTMQVFEDVVMF